MTEREFKKRKGVKGCRGQLEKKGTAKKVEKEEVNMGEKGK